MNVRDPESLRAYQEVGIAALAKHGGSLLASGPIAETIEGKAALVDRIVIFTFPDVASARAWIADPELQESHALRNAGADSNIVILG